MSLLGVILPSRDTRAALADAGVKVKAATEAVVAARQALERAEEDLEAAEAARERAGREWLRHRARELRE